MSELDESAGFTVAEAETTVVANDGTIVSEDVKALLDEEGNPVALDDLVTVEAPDGSAAFDEVISVADEDGNLVPVEETVGRDRRRGQHRDRRRLALVRSQESRRPERARLTAGGWSPGPTRSGAPAMRSPLVARGTVIARDDLMDLVGHQAVGLAVHGVRSLGVGALTRQ